MNTTIRTLFSTRPMTPTLRSGMEAIARALGAPLGPQADAALALTIHGVSVSIAPTRQGRIAAMFRVVVSDTVTRSALVAALAESARWGANGQTLRFVVLDGALVLLWSPAPMPETRLLEELEEALVNALAVAGMAPQTA